LYIYGNAKKGDFTRSRIGRTRIKILGSNELDPRRQYGGKEGRRTQGK